jgi:hypothetical protein
LNKEDSDNGIYSDTRREDGIALILHGLDRPYGDAIYPGQQKYSELLKTLRNYAMQRSLESGGMANKSYDALSSNSRAYYKMMMHYHQIQELITMRYTHIPLPLINPALYICTPFVLKYKIF